MNFADDRGELIFGPCNTEDSYHSVEKMFDIGVDKNVWFL